MSTVDERNAERQELAADVYDLAVEADVSIQDVAREILGVSPATFYFWRTGQHAPSLAAAFMLAAVKGMLSAMVATKELPVTTNEPLHNKKTGTERLIAKFAEAAQNGNNAVPAE